MIFEIKIISDNQPGNPNGHPPRNKSDVNIAKMIMFPYSPRKNNANVKELYSTL